MSDDPLAGLAELLELSLATRPERMNDAVFPTLPPEIQHALRATTEATATLAIAEAPVAPGDALRARVLASIAARRARAARKAVLVIDMLNDHLAPGRPLEVPRARDVVPALAKRLDDARAGGVPVVYVCDRHDP